jgi:hypothetical protein
LFSVICSFNLAQYLHTFYFGLIKKKKVFTVSWHNIDKWKVINMETVLQ